MSELKFETLKAAIEEQHRQNPFSGVIHVSHQDTSIFSHAYGLANRSDQIPNRLNTRFGIASGGKIFTATAICQLVSTGQLRFEQPIQEIIPGLLPNLDPGITIDHLLTHTSGMPDYFDEETETDYEACWHDNPVYRMRSAMDFIPLVRDLEMKFKPGDRFSYSNMGFVLLGLIIEKVSGLRFQDYIEQKIFGAAWMRSSGYFASDNLPEHCATGYIDHVDGSWHANIFSIPVIGHGDGGAFSTAADMGRFWKALFSNIYFESDVLTRMTYPHVPTDPDGSGQYGYGIWIKQHADNLSYYVVGEDPGVEFYSGYYPDLQLQITLLSNTNGALWEMSRTIRSELLQLE